MGWAGKRNETTKETKHWADEKINFRNGRGMIPLFRSSFLPTSGFTFLFLFSSEKTDLITDPLCINQLPRKMNRCFLIGQPLPEPLFPHASYTLETKDFSLCMYEWRQVCQNR